MTYLEDVTEIKNSLKSLVEINQRLEEVERGLQFTSERLEWVVKNILPAISSHMTKLAEGLAMQNLQIDVHRRKWNLILHGLKGRANESDTDTRAACIKLAKDVLKVPDAETTQLAACHRLSKKENAGVILRFSDLSQRDRWLSGSFNLRGTQHKISISQDLPPVLRPLKDSLMLKRKNFTPEQKSQSRVHYLPVWPFVELQRKNRPPQHPETPMSDVLSKIIDMNPLFKVVENTELAINNPSPDK